MVSVSIEIVYWKVVGIVVSNRVSISRKIFVDNILRGNNFIIEIDDSLMDCIVIVVVKEIVVKETELDNGIVVFIIIF